MAQYKLTYFDFHGGRGEPARMALAMAGIAFEDDRVPVGGWEQRKLDTPFGALPVLEIDGQTLAGRWRAGAESPSPVPPADRRVCRLSLPAAGRR